MSSSELMILYEQAHTIAVDYLQRQSEEGGIELAVVEESTIEKPYGWIFWYQSKKWVETRQMMAALFGTHPFIVEKAEGDVTFLSGRPGIEFTYDWNVSLSEQQIAYEDRRRTQNATPSKGTE